MLIYIINIILIIVYGVLFRLPKSDKGKQIAKIAFVLVVFVQLWLLAAFRNNTGNDYYMYAEGFFRMGVSGFSDLSYKDWEIGFILLTKVIVYFTKNKVIYFAVTALLSLIGPAYLIAKYSKMPSLSALLYVNFFFYYIAMNYVRQAIALSIICFAWDFLKKKKFIPYLLIVAVAATFHISALIMLVVYFIVKTKAGIRTILMYAYLLLFYYILSDGLLNILFSKIHTEYENSIFITSGISLIYTIVPLTMCVALFFARRYLNNLPAESTYLINMCYFAMLWLIIMTKHSLFERFSYYSYIFIILAVPEALYAFKSWLPAKIKERMIKRDMGAEKISEAVENTSEDESMPTTELSESSGGFADEYYVKRSKRKAANIYKYVYAAVVLITTAYHIYGLMAGTNGVHGVVPYSSAVLTFLNW